MKISVGKIYELIDDFAPFSSAEPFDKVGLMVGSLRDEVTSILLALDLTLDVIDRAKASGANLIITHHPVIFSPLDRLTDETPTSQVVRKAIKNDINVISAHTNLDAAPQGVTQTLAQTIGLSDIRIPENCAMMRLGRLPNPLSPKELAILLKEKLGSKNINVTTNAKDKIQTVAVLAGRGCSYLQEAKDNNVDAYILGEIKHENAIYANIMNLCIFACGHHQTEVIVLEKVKLYLQMCLNELQLVGWDSISLYERPPMTEY